MKLRHPPLLLFSEGQIVEVCVADEQVLFELHGNQSINLPSIAKAAGARNYQFMRTANWICRGLCADLISPNCGFGETASREYELMGL